MDIKLKLALKIKSLREEKKISQEKLANLSGLDRTYVQSIEKGRRNISILTLEKLSVALGIPLHELVKNL
jgi:transcriptional regulator with XRE-family HTH domain